MFFLKPFRLIARALSEDNSPSQMALGVALGVMIGLVPKGNLIAIVLMILLGMIRLNLGMGMLTALIVSCLAPVVDPLTHWIGTTLLTMPSLNEFFTDLYNMPVVPWTRFNNTVVLGGTVLGACLLLPVFLISRPMLAKYVPDWSERLKKYRLWQLLFSGELVGKLS